MVAIDTNVLVRLLVNDNAAQHRVSRKLFESEEVFIADTVLLETEWVLRDAFDLADRNVCSVLRKVCGLPGVKLQNAPLIARAIDWHEKGLDFADAMHLATTDNHPFRTFDKDLIKRAGAVSGRRVTSV